MRKLKKALSLTLAFALALGLMVPAFAVNQEDQIIVAGGETYDLVLVALLKQPEDKQAVLKFETDIQLTNFSVVLGTSDYGGLFQGSSITVPPRDVVVDLNGHTLTSEVGYPIFEVQNGYTLTIIDSSAGRTGKLVAQGDTEVDVKPGGKYNPLNAPEETEKPEEPEQVIEAGGETYNRVLLALLYQPGDRQAVLKLKTDIQLTNSVPVVLGTSDYGGMFNGDVYTIAPHDVVIDLNGHTLTSDVGTPAFEVQDGYTLTIIDSSAAKTGRLVGQGDTDVVVREGGTYIPLNAPTQPEQPGQSMAKAGDQNIEIGGKPVAFQTYMLADANGNGTNYVKLRDIAHVLNGTAAQFSVGYDRQNASISATTGTAYKDTGTEMDTPFAGADKEYVQSQLTIVVNGTPVQLDAITLMDANGGGYNYFKLRDLGSALGFKVGYSRDRGVYVETE